MAHILVASMAFDAERGGGSTRIAYETAMNLAKRGHHVTVVCEDQFGRGSESEARDGITVLSYKLPEHNRLDIWRHRSHIQAVKRLLAKYHPEPPDIIHGHSLFQYSAALDFYPQQSRCCYTIYSPSIDELNINWSRQGAKGKIKKRFGLPIIKYLEKTLLLRSSRLTALSHYTAALIASHYGDAIARKIQIIPGWVDLKKFHPIHPDQVESIKRQLQWPLDVPLFFVVRRLEPRMGLDRLLQALTIVKKHGFAFHAIIGGEGSLADPLKNLRDALRLNNDVTFMGFIPAAMLPLAYNACDASIIPTTQLECFGLIALESLACGKPALVTPIGALPEVMSHIEPTWIARDETPEGIADLLIAFLKKHLRTHSPQEIRGIIGEKYSYEKVMAAYEQFLLG